MLDSKLRLFHSLLAWALCASTAGGAFARDFTVTVVPEQPTRLHAYYSWGPGCSFQTVTANASVKPAHGTLIPHAVMQTIGANPRFGKAGNCAGKQHEALQIDYKSAPGYHGTDSFTVDIIFGYQDRHDVDHFSIVVP